MAALSFLEVSISIDSQGKMQNLTRKCGKKQSGAGSGVQYVSHITEGSRGS
jgi:hypothetical protein